ncbi:HipA N-terminal domain-containing protein [uncultured Winogradskyella sp.]|uniref:HipA N-terminal domain-containing protein n=1 Tax=uncultured Winogradskyella sp. TaxID=395353 RepID=UPI00261F3F0B|nr:HipA N-terminal domain-containing protein [uncultured Winogradskyella sp.]
MKEKLKNILQKLTPWSGDDEFLSKLNSKNENAKFELSFEDKLVGILEFSEDKWFFEYSKEYKEKQFVLPLINFPDIDKKYEFEELMPFFATRIPNLNQPYHEKKLEKLEGDKTSLVSLLKIFGEKSINNPFELKFI